MEQEPDLEPLLKRLYNKLFLLLGLAAFLLCGVLLFAILDNSLDFFHTPNTIAENTGAPVPNEEVVSDEVLDGIHLASGLKVEEGFEIVRAQCTACHSGKLVAQNRATRQGWEEMIRWMQQSQGLWSLGENEPAILNYLATNYGPEETGRRPNIEEIEWYILELDD